MDDFVIQKYRVVKEKYFLEISIFQEITSIFFSFSRNPLTKLLKISLHIRAFQNIQASIFLH